MRRILYHLRTNVIAYLALMIALGGTSYAATQLPRNSVGKKQLKRNAVTASKIQRGAVTTSKLSSSARASLTGAAGAAGAQGAKGEKGDAGPTFTRFAQNLTTGALPGDGIVVDLAGSNGSTGAGTLTVPAQSRLYINGSVDLTNTSTIEPVRVRCTPLVSAPGAMTLTAFGGPPHFADLHQADLDSTGSPNLHTTVGVAGSALVAAGTYNVGIVCTTVAIGAGTAGHFTAAVNVIAVPASS
jgi:hypothetical protein